MVTFNETRARTSRKYVAKKGIAMPNWSKAFPTFRSHSSVLSLEKQPKNLVDPLVAIFKERRAPTSRKHVAEQGILMPNWSKIIRTYRSHSSVFALEKQPKYPIFQNRFISNRPFAGNFQWNACTAFQKICSWARYSDAKLIDDELIDLPQLPAYNKILTQSHHQSLF